jgi:hypothetical protein
MHYEFNLVSRQRHVTATPALRGGSAGSVSDHRRLSLAAIRQTGHRGEEAGCASAGGCGALLDLRPDIICYRVQTIISSVQIARPSSV